LQPAEAGARGLTERRAEIQLAPTAHAGELMPLDFFTAAIHEPTEIANALQVLGPRPTITGIVKSLAGQSGVELRREEIPVGVPVSFVLHADGLGPHPTLQLSCVPAGRKNLTLVAGQREGTTWLEFAGLDTLFLTVDPDGIGQSGCDLTATVTNEATGSSDQSGLGRIVRLPKIERLAVPDEKIGDGLYGGTLVGESLDVIDKTGWNAVLGSAVRVSRPLFQEAPVRKG
jgi:hypothetical protein